MNFGHAIMLKMVHLWKHKCIIKFRCMYFSQKISTSYNIGNTNYKKKSQSDCFILSQPRSNCKVYIIGTFSMISHPQWAKTRKKSPISKTKINIQHLEANCNICFAHKWTFFQVSAHCVHIHDPQQDEYWRFSKVTALHIMQSRWRHHDQNILQAHTT